MSMLPVFSGARPASCELRGWSPLLFILLSVFLPTCATAFAPGSGSSGVPYGSKSVAAIPDALSSDAAAGIAQIGSNLSNLKLLSTAELTKLDQAIGFTQNERAYWMAVSVFAGVSQREAGRKEYRQELVDRIASGEVSVEEALRAEAQLEIERRKAEAKRLAKEKKEAIEKRIVEQREEAKMKKVRHAEAVEAKKEEAAKRVAEAKAEKERLYKERLAVVEAKKAEKERLAQERKDAAQKRKQEQLKAMEEKKAEKAAKIKAKKDAAKMKAKKKKDAQAEISRKEAAKKAEQDEIKREVDRIAAENAELEKLANEKAASIREKSKNIESKKQSKMPPTPPKTPPPRMQKQKKQEAPKKEKKKLKETVSLAVKASPLAKVLAGDHNLDLTMIKGTGQNGRILADDVRGFLAKLDDNAGNLYFANS